MPGLEERNLITLLDNRQLSSKVTLSDGTWLDKDNMEVCVYELRIPCGWRTVPMEYEGELALYIFPYDLRGEDAANIDDIRDTCFHKLVIDKERHYKDVLDIVTDLKAQMEETRAWTAGDDNTPAVVKLNELINLDHDPNTGTIFLTGGEHILPTDAVGLHFTPALEQLLGLDTVTPEDVRGIDGTEYLIPDMDDLYWPGVGTLPELRAFILRGVRPRTHRQMEGHMNHHLLNTSIDINVEGAQYASIMGVLRPWVGTFDSTTSPMGIIRGVVKVPKWIPMSQSSSFIHQLEVYCTYTGTHIRVCQTDAVAELRVRPCVTLSFRKIVEEWSH